ncbi:IS200/IS605 family element transposase accessory protein TnpB [Salmonella enterica subsp. enterica serovar Stanleyville]|nr:IS200/IS605 family element transposase accessory protein TnpB [Salmonella enterica subsp. enterica serovar Stanleyville]EGR9405478.1 IS200/IS605 family element transposase accessory protein TnpB [Salmonella enterica subsp. enterica serovar Stanleyville]EGS3308081.1 IS200/IS605 family element transposase accessory protein TnpB [Salmonella enterica subsp. enterica serovar Stanleyville]EGS3356909.1 IS200/IS605 family element transposase accessory protein TnpB [Salmonella enterica subsp. enterica
MLILKAYKFRLEPTPEQSQRLRQLCGCARFVWNLGLAETKRIPGSGEKLPSAFELNRMLTVWKKMPGHIFLQDAYTDNLQQKLKDLHAAWKRCFDKKLAAKAPVWKRKNEGRDSIRFVNFEKYCRLENRRVKLPSGLGWVEFRQSQRVNGKIKNATISQLAGQWYISFQVEVETAEPNHTSTTIVGLDAGVTKLATLSDGTVYQPVNSFKASQRKLATLQRQLSRKVKFSSNWQKQKRKVQRLHSHIANIRRDYLHKVTSEISKNHAMIVIEDLKVSNMSKSAKGTAEQHGRNVKAKSGLNRSILDQGWYEMRRQLEYKQLWRGGQVLAVPPAYTSQRCACCGHTAKENRLSQSKFVCQACGYTANADVNGARNILAAGHAVLACGGMVQSGRPSETGTRR